MISRRMRDNSSLVGKKISSQIYPEYNHIVLSGNKRRILLMRFKTSWRFSSARGSPPKILILFIYGLSANLIN